MIHSATLRFVAILSFLPFSESYGQNAFTNKLDVPCTVHAWCRSQDPQVRAGWATLELESNATGVLSPPSVPFPFERGVSVVCGDDRLGCESGFYHLVIVATMDGQIACIPNKRR